LDGQSEARIRCVRTGVARFGVGETLYDCGRRGVFLTLRYDRRGERPEGDDRNTTEKDISRAAKTGIFRRIWEKPPLRRRCSGEAKQFAIQANEEKGGWVMGGSQIC